MKIFKVNLTKQQAQLLKSATAKIYNNLLKSIGENRDILNKTTRKSLVNDTEILISLENKLSVVAKRMDLEFTETEFERLYSVAEQTKEQIINLVTTFNPFISGPTFDQLLIDRNNFIKILKHLEKDQL